MKNTLETRLGLFFALALVATVFILELSGTLELFKKGYPVHATFANVQELKNGDPVKLAGVEIGHVEGIALQAGRAKVSMKIRDEFELKTDSRAVIKFTGLMGQNFIAIEGGTADAPKVLPGAALDTYEQPDLSVLMAKLENVATGIEGLTKSFSTENFSTLFGPITDFMSQNSPQLSAIIGNMRTVSGNIAEGKGTVGKLINDTEFYDAAFSAVTNFQSAAAGLGGMMDKADGMIDDIRGVVGSVREGQGTIGKLATDETLYNEFTVAARNLREILEKMNQGQGTIGGLINDDTFLKNAKLTLQKVEKATEGLEDQGPLSVIGIAISPLF